MPWRVLIILFWSYVEVHAQTGSVRGQVQGHGKSVPYAHVGIKESGLGTSADSTGHFLLSQIPVGEYQLTATAVGFRPASTRIIVKAGESSTLLLPLEEDNAQLEEVVVTGTMREVTKLASPISVEVFSPTFFRRNPTPNIFEALTTVNGVQPQINCNVCNTGDIHINGLEGPYTMILIDGMPIVSSLSTVYGLAGIPNSLVKRMEVVKGPASTLYGSEAVGGVINIITKDPAGSPRLKLDVFGTSVGEYNADISSGFRAGKHRALLGVNIFNYTQPQDINHDNFTDVTLQRRISIFNKWNLSRPSGKQFSLALRYVQEDRWGGELQWTPDYRGSNVYYGESISTNRFETIGHYEFIGRENISVDFSYNFHRQDSYYGTNPFLASQQVAFTQLRWNKTIHQHELLAGLPIRFTEYDDNTPGTATQTGENAPSQTVLPGIFLQDEIKFSSKVTVLLGGRYDHHNIHGNIFTERISVKYSPNPSSTFRLTGGSGYRVVNLFTEEHAALTGARTVIISNKLNPEKSWNANLGFARLIPLPKGFVNLDASIFYTYFSNKIVGDFNTDPNKIIFDNLSGYAVSQGVTLNSDFSFTSSLKLIAGVTLLNVYRVDEKVSTEKIPQLHAPAWSGTFTFSYSLDRIGLSADLTGRINGPMYLPVVPNDYRPAQSPAYGLINLQFTKVINQRWEVYAGVKNLLNFIPKDPLLRPFDPFDRALQINNPYGYTFDTSYNYAPMQGMKGFLGIRFTLL